MRNKIVALLACVALCSVFVGALAQDTRNEVVIPDTGSNTLSAPAKLSAEHTVPDETPVSPEQTSPAAPGNNVNITLDNLAFFDTERENVEMFAATADVGLSSIEGTVVYAQDDEVRIDTSVTEFCMMQAGTHSYEVGETVTIWVAIA